MEAKNKSQRVKVLGIVNISPESFSYALSPIPNSFNQEVFTHSTKLLSLDPEALDIGAVSTRPGSQLIDTSQELKRYQDFLPALLSKYPQAKISLDCFRHEVLGPLLVEYNIHYINDVTGFSDPKLIELASTTKAEAIVMHSAGQVPALTNIADDYYPQGLKAELLEFFAAVITKAERQGINRARLILDPGLGFAKNLRHSFELLTVIPELRREFGLPILIGASRKSFLITWFEQALSRLSGRDYKHGLISALLELAEELSGLEFDQDAIAADFFKQFPSEQQEADDLLLRDKLTNLYNRLVQADCLRVHDYKAVPRLV